jgi:AraC family transcriptional regulator
MNLFPDFKILKMKRLVGKRLTMSFALNRTGELWRSFMPQRHRITGMVSADLFSVEIYPSGFFDRFDPLKNFEKWAAAEVTAGSSVLPDMEELVIPEGLYAVFRYVGRASDAQETYRYIFETWLPESGYRLDDRPHFALMGEKYRNDSADSEEEIFIPVCKMG